MTSWPFSWLPEAEKGLHFVRLRYGVGRLTREAGERKSVGTGGHVDGAGCFGAS